MSEKDFLQKFDTIVMLAVFEHIPVANRAAFVASCHDLLKEGGKVIMTIPVPAVDKIIDTLTALKLADGMDLENHEDVPDQVIEDLFSEPKFRRLKKQYFQFGLNRLFVFERALA
jgi:cyclopropane fatty-acyl-phospholipid synthase-like methyltransferase